MTVSDKLSEIVQYLTIDDFPIGIYVVTPDGQIVEANKLARQLLGLPEGKLNYSILELYRNSTVRDGILKTLETLEKEGKHLSKILDFKVNGHDVYIQDQSRPLRDPETGALLGYLCCAVDMTEEVNYRQMFDALPVGVYLLDKNDKIIQVNEPFAKLLGYDSSEEIEGKFVHELYVDPEDAIEFRQWLEKDDFKVDHIAHVQKKNANETLFVSVSATKITSPSGEYNGRRGTLMDGSKERYRRILDVAPIGLYEVHKVNGEDRVVHCNQCFADINEFDNIEHARNYDLSKMHSSTEGYERFVRDLEESNRTNSPLDNYKVKVKTIKKNEKIFEVSSSALLDRNKNIIGRIGAVKDITDKEKFKNKVAELTRDIGNVLHTYSSSLVSLQQSADAVIESLAPDPFSKIIGLQIMEVLSVLAVPTRQLALSLKRLLSLIKDEERLIALSSESWQALSEISFILEGYERIVLYPEFRPSTLREASLKLLKILAEIKGGSLPKELIKNLRGQTQELLRLLNLYSLNKISFLTSELGPQIRAFRDYVISDIRLEEPEVVRKISSLVTQVISNVTEFAEKRRVNFRRKIECPATQVKIVERDVVRALANILHNGIKYSWNRADGSNAFVGIHVYIVEGQIHMEVESYGVPIPKDEIDQGLLFYLGFRGRMSGDRGRVGTGVGLTDALHVARTHGGDVIIKSQPAIFGRDEDDYSQPFLTTVTFILPIDGQ